MMPLDATRLDAVKAGPGTRWNLLVDADGNRMNGSWKPGLYWAQTPIEVKFGGTTPPYPSAHPWWSDGSNRENFLKQAAKDRKNFIAAVFDLSQTPSGRRRLEIAKSENITYVFDKARTDASHGPTCDFKNKRIYLIPGSKPTSLQLTSQHENRHVGDHARGLLLTSGKTLQEGLSTSYLLEALARTAEAEHAVQCEADMPGYPVGRYKPWGVMGALTWNFSALGEAAKKAAHHISEGNKDAFRAEVFPVFYKDASSKRFYGEAVLGFYDRVTPKRPRVPDKGRENSGHRRDFNNEMSEFMNESGAMRKFASGLAFLKIAAYSLNDPLFTSISPELEERALALQTKMRDVSRDCLFKPNTAVCFMQKASPTTSPLNEQTVMLRRLIARPVPGGPAHLGAGD